MNKKSRYVTFTSKNDRDHQEGFVITAKTHAGQTKSVSISVNAK